jgi:hypothetical protein
MKETDWFIVLEARKSKIEGQNLAGPSHCIIPWKKGRRERESKRGPNLWN